MVQNFLEDNLQYREGGSYRFTEEQRNAYILAFTIQVLSFVNEPYASFKTNPANGFWGKATIFYGAEVIRTVPMEYAKQRFIHVIARDNLNAALIGASLATVQSGLIAVAVVAGGSIGAQPLNLPEVSGFPETVIKFVGLPLAQYQFTCYWLPQQEGFAEFIEPFAEDPTDGDSEYPMPRRNPADDPYANNAPPSPPNPDSDPRDFPPANLEGSFPRTVYFGVRTVFSSAQGQPNNCVGDVTVFDNLTIEDFGPPPYTAEFGYLPSPCVGFGSGRRIRASDGTLSPEFAAVATVTAFQINVFQFTPFV